jgi:hypothetical protein
MRMNFLSCSVSLGLALASTCAAAGERWVYLGDVHVAELAASGKLSLNLDSLHKRGRHYEIWERVVVESEPGRRAPAAAPGSPSVRRTLWAIRCRFGEMAKVTEGTDGAFEPRAESLRFFGPRPDSPNAAVLATTCAEVRRIVAETRPPQPREEPKHQLPTSKELEAPPMIFDPDGFEYGEE